MMFSRAIFSQFFQMKAVGYPLCVGQTILREKISSAAISASRVTFARMDAALISGTRLSPFTTAIEGIGNFGQRLPSINTYSGAICSPATARASPAWSHEECSVRFVGFRAAQTPAQRFLFDLFRAPDGVFFSAFGIIQPGNWARGQGSAAVMTAPTNGLRPTSSTPQPACG